jgi:zinc transporter ZupT
MNMPLDVIKTAFFWGLVSAVSLPLGALLGLLLKPSRKITSALMAFGAGALLFALTIELFSEALHFASEHGNRVIVATIVGALAGGLLFDALNQILNNRGAFVRKLGTTRRHLTKIKVKMARRLINDLSRVRLLQSLPPDSIAKLIPNMKRETFEPDSTIFSQGEMGTTLYFIVQGTVEIIRRNESGSEILVAVLSDHDTFGEMALLGNSPRNATARSKSKTLVLKAQHSDFDALLAESDELREHALVLFHQRAEHLSEKSDDYQADEWESQCLRHLQNMAMPLTDREIHEDSHKATLGKGAAMAIWLGILLDGIPESLIIGIFSASVTGISVAFITGVFLANLPEAMSSAVGMRQSGMSFRRILIMWSSLCLITAVGAAIGVLLFPPGGGATSHLTLGLIEGLAAGAMLTMIAETMLPEAYEQGGAIVGFATLLGFLTALVVKVI